MSTAPQSPTTGVLTHTDGTGQVTVMLDFETFDFYLEATAGAPMKAIDEAIRFAALVGYSLLEEPEAEVRTSYGWTRIYMAPIVPVEDLINEPVEALAG